MAGAEVMYADVKFSKSKSKGRARPSEVTYSEVRNLRKHTADSQPADSSKIKKVQPRPKKKLQLTVERVALLVLSILLAAAIIALSVTSVNCRNGQEEVNQLNACMTTSAELKNETCLKYDAGWEQHGGNCYYFNTNKSSWNNSRSSCVDLGGDLVKIDCREEQEFLDRRVRAMLKTETDKFWIGLTDSKDEGRWFWVDGSPLDESFWSDGQPDNKSGESKTAKEQDCVRMGTKKEAEDLKSWFDRSCHDPNRSICEKAANVSSCVCV